MHFSSFMNTFRSRSNLPACASSIDGEKLRYVATSTRYWNRNSWKKTKIESKTNGNEWLALRLCVTRSHRTPHFPLFQAARTVTFDYRKKANAVLVTTKNFRAAKPMMDYRPATFGLAVALAVGHRASIERAHFRAIVRITRDCFCRVMLPAHSRRQILLGSAKR